MVLLATTRCVALWLAASMAHVAALNVPQCPAAAQTVIARFEMGGVAWIACEDLQRRDGAVAIVSTDGITEWFEQSYEPYTQGAEDNYYLNLTKRAVMSAKADVLAVKLLSANYTHLTYELVKSAVPPMVKTGVRTFVGSRAASVDTSLSDLGEDANGYGFPSVSSRVINLTNIAAGGLPIADIQKHINTSFVADGMVGGHLPVVRFSFPIRQDSPYLAPGQTNGTSRYWDMVAAGAPDMKGSREQTVWFKFQEIRCDSTCTLVGSPQFYDTYWWSNSPSNSTDLWPSHSSSAAGFYSNLLENRRWWASELAAERMMELTLPSPLSTNGTYLKTQAMASVIKAMITRKDGINMQDGFQDTFTTTAQAALEMGAVSWARGLIDHQFKHYVRLDGMIHYRGEEIAQSARMLTVLSLCYSYDICDAEFLLTHFDKAKGLAGWLIGRRGLSLGFDRSDPRYGMLPGDDEADNYNRLYFHQMVPLHFYSSNAESYRAFVEMGAVWKQIGSAAKRKDVTAHASMLLSTAPLLYRDMHTSLKKTMNITADGDRCYPHRTEGNGPETVGQMSALYRSMPEVFFSGALTEQQMDDMYKSGLGLTSCENTGRWLCVGSPSAGTAPFTHVPFGFPHGLLQHDMVERFLLYFFTQSAHANTRGTWTTPESASIDRSHGAISYSAAGVNNVPLCIKWMHVFEEPETRTLWLAKATPRDWLVPGETPLVVEAATTRYGRVSFSLRVPSAEEVASSGYTVYANLTLPPGFATRAPDGGLLLRVRAPMAHAGKLSEVTVGGKTWKRFNASSETISFTPEDLASDSVLNGLTCIVASFSAKQAAELRRAQVDLARRVIQEPAPIAEASSESGKSTDSTLLQLNVPGPDCPSGTSLLDSFTIHSTQWSACEDLQVPDGQIALVSSAGAMYTFPKTWAPYGTNLTDNKYYLGLGQTPVANAASDVLGAKLMCESEAQLCEPTWKAVASAVPPIRKSGSTSPDEYGHWGTNCRNVPAPSNNSVEIDEISLFWDIRKGQNCSQDTVRTFIGGRSSSNDFTLDDETTDCSWNGGPTWSLAVDMHNKAVGEPAQHWNTSGIADGMIGGVLPTAIYYIPIAADNVTDGTSRYWTYLNIPKPDSDECQGDSREPGVWIRYQQVSCAGPDHKPPCKLHGKPMYWDSMAYAHFPGANESDTNHETLITGPVNASQPAGFWANLLKLKEWWEEQLEAEGMMKMSLPAPSSTNGTYLSAQAVHSIVRSMITRQAVFHPRYGTTPGFGADNLHGLPEIYTSTAIAALEMGAMEYAKGVTDNYFQHYVRPDGMLMHHGMEVPASSRVLTVLALYYHYNGGNHSLVLQHFAAAKALAEWLMYRRSLSLNYNSTDPRYGIPQGDAESINYLQYTGNTHSNTGPTGGEHSLHFLSSAAEMARAFDDLGDVWQRVGNTTSRGDVKAHGLELVKVGAMLRHDLQVSLRHAAQHNSGTITPCLPFVVDKPKQIRGQAAHAYIAYPQMLYSGVLSHAQVDGIYKCMAAGGGDSNGSLTVGVPGWHGHISLRSPFGLAFALVQHDMIERFLLHFYAVSAHGYTRGSWTTPESSNLVDRDEPAVTYASVGVHTVPIYLKWMHVFEEPETRTLWLAKATPRDWLVPGETPLVVEAATTRYGRVSFSLRVPSAEEVASSGYTVYANLTLPPGFATRAPDGGLLLRVRAPMAHAGKLSEVTVGGKTWKRFNASSETISFTPEDLASDSVLNGLTCIVASFSATGARLL